MATNPTAANIIASLGVKGVVSSVPDGHSAAEFAGFLPVLDAEGHVNVDFVPSSGVERIVHPISNVSIVDPRTTVEVRTGSAVAPYKSIHEAAENIDRTVQCAILLMPGTYRGNDNTLAQFHASQQDVCLIGVGRCRLASSLTITGVSGANVFLQNISTSNSVTIQGAAQVVCLGRMYIGDNLNVGSLCTLRISDESRVASTDATDVSYLSETAYIGNTSRVAGKTAEDALNRLEGRKIKVDKIDYGESGFYVDESCDDISAESSGDHDVFDLTGRNSKLVEGLNDLIEKGKNPKVGTLTADNVVAKVIKAEELKMSAITLGGSRIGIDPYGYVVVLDDGDSGEDESGSVYDSSGSDDADSSSSSGLPDAQNQE